MGIIVQKSDPLQRDKSAQKAVFRWSQHKTQHRCFGPAQRFVQRQNGLRYGRNGESIQNLMQNNLFFPQTHLKLQKMCFIFHRYGMMNWKYMRREIYFVVKWSTTIVAAPSAISMLVRIWRWHVACGQQYKRQLTVQCKCGGMSTKTSKGSTLKTCTAAYEAVESMAMAISRKWHETKRLLLVVLSFQPITIIVGTLLAIML